jgi:hypothetical protein
LPPGQQPPAELAQVEQARYPAVSAERDVTPLPLPKVQPRAEVAEPPQPEAKPPARPDADPKAAEEPPLITALRCFMNKRPYEAVAWLERYDRTNQDLLLVLLPLAARLAELNLAQANRQEVAAVVTQLNSALDPLRPLAELSVERMCFCREIIKFGDYRPLPDDYQFRPGETALVYMEIQNFSSEARGKLFVTRLASSARILDYQGNVINSLSECTLIDHSQTRRHDYCRSCWFNVPRTPGSYTLWIKVTDVPTGRAAEKSLDFQVTTLPNRPG